MKEIPLTKGAKAVVDDADYEFVNTYKWYLDNVGYACHSFWSPATNRRYNVRLHQFLLDVDPPLTVDHINGNRLDCRRNNLRVATREQNQWNRRKYANRSSQFKGVKWRKLKNSGHWQATITHHGKRQHLGSFDREDHAALVYDWAASELFGEFARLNFPNWRNNLQV
jgi:HNH endonuclease